MKQTAAPITPRQQPRQRAEKITKSPRRETQQTQKLSWVSFLLPPNLAYYFSRQYQQRNIDAGDVKEWPNDEPHITVRWGLHTKHAKTVAKLLRGRPLFAVCRFTHVEIFRNPDQDVLVCRVDSPQLQQLHKLLGTLPNTTTHPDYNPHVTIAYLRRGKGDLYQDMELKVPPQQRFLLKALTFHHGDKSIPLNVKPES